MFPFEFIVIGVPISSQASTRSKTAWKQKVEAAARQNLNARQNPSAEENLKMIITYYYEGETPDVDNIIKPIQDALNSCIYQDDNQISDTRSRKKDINGSYSIRGKPSIILQAFAEGDEFVHVKIEKDNAAGEIE